MNLTLINISIIIGCTLIGYLFGSFSCGKLVAKLAGLQELPLNKSGRISVASLWQSKHWLLSTITIIFILFKFALSIAVSFAIIKLDYNSYVICAESAICDFDGNCHSPSISACTFNPQAFPKESYSYTIGVSHSGKTMQIETLEPIGVRQTKELIYLSSGILCIIAFIIGTFCPLRRKRQTK